MLYDILLYFYTSYVIFVLNLNALKVCFKLLTNKSAFKIFLSLSNIFVFHHSSNVPSSFYFLLRYYLSFHLVLLSPLVLIWLELYLLIFHLLILDFIGYDKWYNISSMTIVYCLLDLLHS